jgi:hypothetical protein
MRLNWLVSGRALKNALLALACGGVVAASCTFSPGPAGSAPSSGSGTGYAGAGILGVANSNGHGGTTGTGTGTTGTAGTGNGSGNPTPDGQNCGLQSYGLENIPPDLLIILDKSGSMGDQPDGTKCDMIPMCPSKWVQMTAAIDQVVTQTDTTIRWGLKYFADMGSCGVTPGAAVPIAPNNGMAITTSIAANMPGPSTPTRLAVQSGAAYLQTVMDPNPKFILLATDGLPNCAPGARKASDDDSAGAVMAVTAAAAAGFPVFVVGVGNTGAEDTLNMLATAGGRPQAGAQKYFPVASTADLVSVLKTIGGQITSCSFGLGQAPPDPTNVGVYADGDPKKKIPRDPTHTNGWDYGAGMRSVVLYGTACDNVKNMVTKTIQAIYGCPGLVIP